MPASHLATPSQVLFNPDEDQGMFNQQVVTGDDGRFAFPAQCERFTLLAVHGSGYAELDRRSRSRIRRL